MSLRLVVDNTQPAPAAEPPREALDALDGLFALALIGAATLAILCGFGAFAALRHLIGA